MKKTFAIIMLSFAFLTSCDKQIEQPDDWSSVVFIQASPISAAIPTDTLHVFVDTMRYNSTGIRYNTASAYIPVVAGNRNIDIRRGVNSTFTNYINTFAYNFERGQAYSFFIYDTTTSATSQARILRLKDDLTLPASGTTHVRFLHLAPNTQAVDVTLLRTSATPNDSITISNKSYVGATPNEAELSAFSAVPGGTYTVKIKRANTQTVLSSTASVALNAGRIVTLYATGTAKGRPLTLGTFRHY